LLFPAQVDEGCDLLFPAQVDEGCNLLFPAQVDEVCNLLLPAQVDEGCEQVEAALVRLEDVVEEQEYMANVTSHHRQLAVYKMKKEHELQTYRGLCSYY